MSYAQLPAPIRAIAENQLTPKQLDAFTAEQNGDSIRRIANDFDISRMAVLDRLKGAYKVLRAHGVTQDANGQWALRAQDQSVTDAQNAA